MAKNPLDEVTELIMQEMKRSEAEQKRQQTYQEVRKEFTKLPAAQQLEIWKEVNKVQEKQRNEEAKRNLDLQKQQELLIPINKAYHDITKEIEYQNKAIDKQKAMMSVDEALIQKKVEGEKKLRELRNEALEAMSKAERKAGPSLARRIMTLPFGGAEGRSRSDIEEGVGPITYRVMESLGTLRTALEGLQSPLGPISVGLQAFGSVLNEIVPGAKAATANVNGILEFLTQAAASAAPGVMAQVSIALQDTVATVGQSFIPVLQIFRDAIQLVGDVLASILPSSQESTEAFAGFRAAFAEVGDAVREVMTIIGPLIRTVLIAGLKAFAAVLKTVAQILKTAFDALRPVLEFFGLDFAKDKTPRTSVGAAARPTAFHGIEEYVKQLQLEAYRGPGRRSTEEIPNILDQMNHKLDKLFSLDDLFSRMFSLTPSGTGESDKSRAAAANAVRSAMGQPIQPYVEKDRPYTQAEMQRGQPIIDAIKRLFS